MQHDAAFHLGLHVCQTESTHFGVSGLEGDLKPLSTIVYISGFILFSKEFDSLFQQSTLISSFGQVKFSLDK